MYGTIQEWEVTGAQKLGERDRGGTIYEVTFSTEIGLVTLDIPPSAEISSGDLEAESWKLSIKGSHVTFEPEE